MKGAFIGVGAVVLLASLGLALALVVRPGDRALAVDVYLLALGGLSLAMLVHVTRVSAGRADRSPFERALRARPERPAPIGELAAIERQTALALGSAFDVHYRLRPLLRDVARHRLAARRGIALDNSPDAARAALGEELWQIVRPDREPPGDRYAPGTTLRDLRGFVERLERI